MAKQLRDKWLGARTTAAFLEQIDDYLELAELNQAELVRQSVVEYMANHPVKKPLPKLTKPGTEE